jgi:hypothetical protein
MGEDPIMVMQNIYFVHGRAGWSAQYMIARTNRSGTFRGPLRWRSEGVGDKLAVTCYADLSHVTEGDDPRVEITVDMAMAKADGWASNEKYKTIPEHMLRWRSATWLIRLYCPEVMMGMPTADELGGGGDFIDVTPPRPVLAEYGDNGFVKEPEPDPPPPRKTRARKEPPPDTDPVGDRGEPEGETGEPERFAFFDMVGVEQAFDNLDAALAAVRDEIAAAKTEREVGTLKENTADFLTQIGFPAAAEIEGLLNERMKAVAPAPETAPAESELVVPLPPQGIDGWYQPARQRVKDMAAAGCTPADFRRFREANAENLNKLRLHGAGWYRMLEELIQKGEAER